MADKQKLQTDRAPAPAGPYSHGVAIDGFVFTAGMAPIDSATGKTVGDDVATQTRQVMKNLGAILAERGLGFEHVVKVTVHLQELHRDFAEFNKAYGEYFTAEPLPVRTTVGSVLNNILVEIDFVAHE